MRRVVIVIVIGVLAGVQVVAQQPEVLEPTFDEGALPFKLVEIARSVADRPLAERMLAISTPLLGRPYVIDGNGEGVAPDLDPPARYDVFDCLTFIEEVLALALAPDPIGAPLVRNGLRYQNGEPGYANRHHFMLHEWIPANIEAGWFENITTQLGETHVIHKQVTPAIWRGWRGTKNFLLTPDQLPVGWFSLPVLSLDAAAAAVDRIPPGALIFTVRRPKRWKPIVVSHVGFVVPGSGPTKMRHSTKMNGGTIRDHFLGWYIGRLHWYDKRPVEGITVLMPKEQGPRISRLGSDR